ncbi:hypothetical protein RRG08_066457 [Elysia crispata]|uniref:Uncharacterized protein n=1 Tax=Elysia crispata TaxID=231223 RepID=A0AAE0Z8R4_9GAST|nr:hypothetical protein RRG08_066457 [Elysia crispata]
MEAPSTRPVHLTISISSLTPIVWKRHQQDRFGSQTQTNIEAGNSSNLISVIGSSNDSPPSHIGSIKVTERGPESKRAVMDPDESLQFIALAGSLWEAVERRLLSLSPLPGSVRRCA